MSGRVFVSAKKGIANLWIAVTNYFSEKYKVLDTSELGQDTVWKQQGGIGLRDGR